MSTPSIVSGRSVSRWAPALACALCLGSQGASAALTATLARPGAPLREHDAFTLVLTLSNTGGFPLTSVSAILRLAVPEAVAIETAPAIGPASAIPANDSLQLVWNLRALRAGPETLTVQAMAFSKGSSPVAEASRIEIIAPKAGVAAAYPNPVSGDVLTLVLNLTEDAETVTAEVFNASFRLVANDAWRDVPHGDPRVALHGVSSWAPGIYAIRIKARSARGEERAFPMVKVQVRRS